MEMKESQIKRKDWEEYIFGLFFGKGDKLENCIARAYRDFSRTLHGFGKLSDNYEITNDFKKNHLKKIFENVKKIKFKNQDEFDSWHEKTCRDIIDYYKQKGYKEFYIGQAQKWINMTFKYIYSYGENNLEGYIHIYRFCHVPIDNILLEKIDSKLNSYNRFDSPWSRIKDYSIYLEFQKWFRKNYEGIPLDNEFRIWKS